MTRDDIELAKMLASVLDGPDMHALGPTDAALVVRCLRAAATQAEAKSRRGPAARLGFVVMASVATLLHKRG